MVQAASGSGAGLETSVKVWFFAVVQQLQDHEVLGSVFGFSFRDVRVYRGFI